MTTPAKTIVEFSDRNSDFWFVVEIQHRLGTIVKRVQEVLQICSRPEWRYNDVTASIATRSILITFSHGDFEPETLALLLAQQLGWRKHNRVLVGRAES